MSEIAYASNPGTKIRSKKISTRIDMTPMVDLAFLLLTFFILTTKLAAPYALDLHMPEEEPDQVPPPVNAKNVFTLILTSHDKIIWYAGIEPASNITDFSKNGVRKLLLERKTANDKLYLFIKPSDKSHYSNLVDILDEMTILSITRYAVVDVDPVEEKILGLATR